MAEDKKGIPVHEICIKDLTKEVVSPAKLLHWAEVYAAGAIVPAREIPILIEIFENALSSVEEYLKLETNYDYVHSNVKLAIENFLQQIAESHEAAEKSAKEKSLQQQICGIVAAIYAGKNWHHDLTEKEMELVKLLEVANLIKPNIPADGFVGKAAH